MASQADLRRSKRSRKPVTYIDDDQQWEDEHELQLAIPSGKRLREGHDEDYLLPHQADTSRPSKKHKLTKVFRFLDLPPEIRNQIYSLALVDPDMLTVQSTIKGHRRTIKRSVIYDTLEGPSKPIYKMRDSLSNGQSLQPLSTHLLAVCKRIHDEAKPILYGQCIVLANTKTLHDFLTTIGWANQQYLTHLVIKGWGIGKGALKAANYYSFAALQNARNLKELCLDCYIDGSSRAKTTALTIYCSTNQFFEHYGRLVGRKDAAVEILRVNTTNFSASGYYTYFGNFADGLEAREEEPAQTLEQKMQLCKEELRKLVLAH